MDDLTLLRNFRAERADDDPRARAAAWQALEVRFGPVHPTFPAAPPRSRRGLLALAGAGMTAAIVAGILVLSSGPTAEPAVAEVLQEAAVAAADTPPESPPGPGQFLYTKTKTLELEGWVPGSDRVSMGSPLDRSHIPNAFAALIPTDREIWISPDGAGRQREILGTPQFLAGAEQSRWEQAGSPLPGNFDPGNQDTGTGWLGYMTRTGGHLLELRRGVVDIERAEPKGGLGPNFGYPDLTGLPTEPKALRLAIEDRQAAVTGTDPGGMQLDTKEMVYSLWGILQQPIVAPALRAAAFNALAELPGIELDSDATDLVGREGYAIGYLDQETGERGEYIFDPETSVILGQRTVLVYPGRISLYEGLSAGLVIRDVAYLQSKVVDSTSEPAEDGQSGGPVATTGG